jgi:isoleucyl-tRNA synthetase
MVPDTQTTPAPKKNYKATLNLPQTSFAMEAKLVQNEPARLQRWRERNLYQTLMDQRATSSKGKWILHDGPPFANGDIHIGHLVNKTLKDIILRFRSMQGYQTPYVPGWDCHGLPIEHKIQQDLGPKLRQMSTVEVRQRCFAYADKYAALQSEQFQRLGILGEWADPYLTMKPTYEASTLEVFARFVEAELVYKQLKPVHWSIQNQTALADAELEYKDVTGPSIYVEFPALFLETCMAGVGLENCAHVYLLIWTTTPWTLPANEAVAINPKVMYALVKYERLGATRYGVVAQDLVEKVFTSRAGVGPHEVIRNIPGEHLLNSSVVYRHPFIPMKRGNLVPADYVTTTDGTGLVHTAPGHGEEDYQTGMAHGLSVYCPVMANGRFDDTVPQWLRGLSVWEANPIITQHLRDAGLLFDETQITHSYPHDWRSQTPTIFRATEQWFIAMDKPYAPPASAAQVMLQPLGPVGEARVPSLRYAAQKACREMIDFVPAWGQARILGMLQTRPDWCISRQRAWGLPIPVFYNEKDQPLLTPQSVRAVARRFARNGSDAWFTDSPAQLLGEDFAYPEGFDPATLRKEKDIFDVWFESGSSWHAVLQRRDCLRFPADLYLEAPISIAAGSSFRCCRVWARRGRRRSSRF